MSDHNSPIAPSESPVPQTRTAGVRSGLSASTLRLIEVFGLWLAVTVLYWPGAVALDAIWRNTIKETYTHGYLVLLISLWLIARDRKRLGATPVQRVPGALIPLVLLSALWLWSWRSAIQEPYLLLMPLILFAAVVAALGWRVARLVAFPIGYLYFAMPLWSNINGIVRALSSAVTGALIWITGLPAYMQGNYVRLPGGTIEIANSCSGLHALIVGLALAALYGEVMRDSRRRRIVWLAVMCGVSLFVNWVRIFIVITAAYLSDMHSHLVKNHYWLGWWLFAAGFAGFLWWAGRKMTPTAPESRPRADRPATSDPSSRGTTSPAWMGLVLIVTALVPVTGYAMGWAHSGARGPVAIDWPSAPRGWTGPFPARFGTWAPVFIHPSGQSLRAYRATGGSVEAFVVAYRTQTQSGKLLGFRNTLLGDRGLRGESTRIVESSSGRWRETLAIGPTGTRSLIWSRYRIGHRLFVEPRLSQLWYGLEALIDPPLSSIIALRTVCTADCTAARQRLRSASAWLRPTLR